MTKSPDTDNTRIALINNNIGYIQKDVSEIKEAIKGLDNVLASKEELSTVEKAVDIRLVKLESASVLWKIASPALAATISGIFVFLLIQYLTKFH